MRLGIQLIAIAAPYMIAWIPYSIVVLVQIFANNNVLAYMVSTILAYLPYVQVLLLPYICVFFMPEVKQKFINLLKLAHLHKNQVQPIELNPHTLTLRAVPTIHH